MKKLIIIMAAILTSGFILLPNQVDTEMSSLTEGEMEEQYFKTWNLSLTADLTNEGNRETETADLVDQEEGDKLNDYLREKSHADTLTPDPDPEVSQLEEWEHIAPAGDIAKGSGRTSSYEAPEIYVGKHDTPPVDILNQRAP